MWTDLLEEERRAKTRHPSGGKRPFKLLLCSKLYHFCLIKLSSCGIVKRRPAPLVTFLGSIPSWRVSNFLTPSSHRGKIAYAFSEGSDRALELYPSATFISVSELFHSEANPVTHLSRVEVLSHYFKTPRRDIAVPTERMFHTGVSFWAIVTCKRPTMNAHSLHWRKFFDALASPHVLQ